MPEPETTRAFRSLHLPHRRRAAENEVDGAPTEGQPGELLYGEEENTLYMTQDDGTVVTVVDGGAAGDYIQSVADETLGLIKITDIVKISQAAYDALVTKSETTLYIIDG